jgi:outer membrane protein OmpA-like peptidoglycan-associated protein
MTRVWLALLVALAACAAPGAAARSRTHVADRLDAVRTPVQACYQERLARSPGLRGKMVLHITVAESGTRLGTVKIVRDEVGDPDLNDCVYAAFKSFRLSEPAKTEVELDYPLEFDPEHPENVIPKAAPAAEPAVTAPPLEPIPEPTPVIPEPTPPPGPSVAAQDSIRILPRVSFKSGSAKIDKAGHALIDEVAKAMREYPDIVLLEIIGSSDTKECQADDLRLSQQRADAVMKALIEKGVEPGRLRAVGHGGNRPLASGSSRADRAKNRYVMFVIPPSP